MWALAKLHKRLLICVIVMFLLWSVGRVHKGLLICVLCNVTGVGGGKGT